MKIDIHINIPFQCALEGMIQRTYYSLLYIHFRIPKEMFNIS